MRAGEAISQEADEGKVSAFEGSLASATTYLSLITCLRLWLVLQGEEATQQLAAETTKALERLSVQHASSHLSTQQCADLLQTLEDVQEMPSTSEEPATKASAWRSLSTLLCSTDPRSAEIGISWLLALLVKTAEQCLAETNCAGAVRGFHGYVPICM